MTPAPDGACASRRQLKCLLEPLPGIPLPTAWRADATSVEGIRQGGEARARPFERDGLPTVAGVASG